ncbi:hypothetical protein [Candidatus Uabimicrobium amorphum]|uniref:hypothetical protein n=1 Tax=Uabimicrobium amorphum TaxID=2596890 RepID=UPI001562F08C|nr:hypothetical protein [Candidatus Uabimicrobium amorphum]
MQRASCSAPEFLACSSKTDLIVEQAMLFAWNYDTYLNHSEANSSTLNLYGL